MNALEFLIRRNREKPTQIKHKTVLYFSNNPAQSL